MNRRARNRRSGEIAGIVVHSKPRAHSNRGTPSARNPLTPLIHAQTTDRMAPPRREGDSVPACWRCVAPGAAEELDRRLLRSLGGGVPFEPRLAELHRRLLDIAVERYRHDHGGRTSPEATETGELALAPYLPRHLEDVHLAWACARRPFQDLAWERLFAAHARALGRVARGAGATAPREETHAFFADLCLPTHRGRALLDTYSGLAPLGAWLRLVFQRRLNAARRRAQPLDLPLDLPDERAPDPEREATRRDFATLLERCLAGLSARDRDLVEARILRAEEGVATARRHGVSPSYVSRRYREVLAGLRTQIAPLLGRVGFRPGESQ